jgi:hypothetical protein
MSMAESKLAEFSNRRSLGGPSRGVWYHLAQVDLACLGLPTVHLHPACLWAGHSHPIRIQYPRTHNSSSSQTLALSSFCNPSGLVVAGQ